MSRHPRTIDPVKHFNDIGVPVTTEFTDGGHEWFIWRRSLKDFLESVVFQPP